MAATSNLSLEQRAMQGARMTPEERKRMWLAISDITEAQFVTPGLTTVRQPLAEMGRMAVSLLVRLLDDLADTALHVELATRLVVRDSTSRL